MFLAIGLLSYETTNTLSAAALAVVAVSQAVQQWLFLGGDFFRPPYAAVIITYALAAFGGSAARINNEAFRARIEAERSRMTLRRVREYAKLSDEIHDHTTGELSLIVRIAQQRIEQDSSEANADPENLKAWGQVEESARTTLHDIRRVINELDDVSDGALALMTDEELQSNEDFERRLHELAAEQDRKLTLAGFRGHGIVAMAKVIFEDPHAQALILDATTEMYGNIARHAVKDEEYTVSVTINQDGALIVTSNVTKPDDGMTGGHGLLALERNLRKHGGSLETELSDGRRYWYADIRI